MKEAHTWLLPLSTPFMFHFYSFTYISILLSILLYFHFPMQLYPDLLHPLPIYCIPSLISCISLILTRILIFPTDSLHSYLHFDLHSPHSLHFQPASSALPLAFLSLFLIIPLIPFTDSPIRLLQTTTFCYGDNVIY